MLLNIVKYNIESVIKNIIYISINYIFLLYARNVIKLNFFKRKGA